MVFIDILAMQLFVLGFSGLILAYMTIKTVWCSKDGKDGWRVMQSGKIPLALLGIVVLVTSLFGQFAWPLPGSYNILFYDVYLMFGVFLIGAAWIIHSKLRLEYLGFFALLIGAMTVFYGYSGYKLGMTSSPIALLGLYTLFGVAGILGYPVTLMFDRMQDKKKSGLGWILVFALFALALVLGSLLAVYIGVSAVPAHLASPP